MRAVAAAVRETAAACAPAARDPPAVAIFPSSRRPSTTVPPLSPAPLVRRSQPMPRPPRLLEVDVDPASHRRPVVVSDRALSGAADRNLVVLAVVDVLVAAAQVDERQRAGIEPAWAAAATVGGTHFPVEPRSGPKAPVRPPPP